MLDFQATDAREPHPRVYVQSTMKFEAAFPPGPRTGYCPNRDNNNFQLSMIGLKKNFFSHLKILRKKKSIN